ncbi:MAG: hypothetical protein HOP10_00680 [Chitinophagaceae bacterium]|nr:hypothetical protein [Chitinophagaceae bacterium]
MRSKLTITCLTVILLIYSCSKSDVTDTDPCTGVNFNITHTHTESIGTSNNGTISILSPRGDTISYKLNNGSYQSSWYFTDLAPGNYVITMKNQKGCTDTAQITILNYGPKYAAVKQLISGGGGGGYCGPCHLGAGNSGNVNFNTDASIVAQWDRIKIRAVDNLPTQMPELPNAMLTPPDKQKIVDWVNAGHQVSN